jgi:hypothetical protein
MSHAIRLSAVFVLALVSACTKPTPDPGPALVGPARCEVDLAATGFFSSEGSGATAALIDSEVQLIGGEGATGRTGDVLLANDKIRVIIEKAVRSTGPILSGGAIVDADIVRPAGQPGRDLFGRMGLFYALGRMTSVDRVEVLQDGSAGGPAVVASTGHDAIHDLLNLKSMLLTQAGLAVDFVVDPNQALEVRSTTYYVLSPGESRVRVLTAFCNDGSTTALMPLVELLDVGAFGLFNPGGCSNALGATGLDDTNCILEASKWIGSQGTGVAYGIRSQSIADLSVPVKANAVLGYGGVIGSFIDGENVNGVLTWADREARSRPGTFSVRAGGQRNYLRDFVVAKDLAGITDTFAKADHLGTGRVEVTATLAAGGPAAGARVAAVNAADDKLFTLLELDGAGKGGADLPPGTWHLSAAIEGMQLGPVVDVSVSAGGTHPVSLSVGPSRKLSITVKDPFGAPMPGKVTVRCSPAPCPYSASTYKQHLFLEQPEGGAAAIAYAGAQGSVDLSLPPGGYEVIVSRGPEYSIWPDTWPLSGRAVDLSQSDAQVNAVLGHVVDSTGWMSADLHVHAANSADSAVPNDLRVLEFMAEGVDVLLSTDHEFITDFAPNIRALGAQDVIASMIGEEVTTFTYGHFNTFPLVRDAERANGGAFDHAGGEDGPSMRIGELCAGIKAVHPGAVVQLNHPRGGSGVITRLQVDTATLASHANPEDFGMAVAPDATADDHKLFGDGFDLIESANGPSPNFSVLNDWMTFLSRGTVRTSSGVSDSHDAQGGTGGYARTYAKVGVDTPAAFSSAGFAEAVRKHEAFVSNGPFLKVTAQKLSAGGAPVGGPMEIGSTLSVSAGESLEFSVDVQGPESMEFDRVELYSWAPGREAVNGEKNSEWPDGRIAQIHTIPAGTLTLEAVPAMNGLTLRRVHHTDSFTVQPSADTWYVVMVRGVSTRGLWPLHGARAAAWTNAFLVDADGSGAYDDFPLKPGQRLRAPQRASTPEPRVPTASELQQAIAAIIDHKHE